jgi:hypothetical protein
VDVAVESVRAELRRARRGQALGSPQATLRFSIDLRRHLVGRDLADADAALAMVAAVRLASSRLSGLDRQIVTAELNIDTVHGHATLTARQESLAAALGCSAKTVRRRADEALMALALVLAAGPAPVDTAAGGAGGAQPDDEPAGLPELLCRFWRLTPTSEIDIVCSEIPVPELPDYALPGDRNYLRYAKFADLDTLIFVRTRLAQLSPQTQVRDFAPSEHHDTAAAAMVVIGGPPWNAKFREFLPQLPFHFEPHPLGADDPLVVPLLDNTRIGPRWTATGELIDDVAVFTRLTLSTGTTVFLLGGCLTAGVLGAARTFLHGEVAAANLSWVGEHIGEDDFVVVTETRRVGGMTDAADLSVSGPLLALRRPPAGQFEVLVDDTTRR